MIALSHVTKHFGSVAAVRDVSFRVAAGESVALLGPNGSGKTTLLRMLTGFFPPTSGKIVVAGFDAAEQGVGLRQVIGYLPEQVTLYPEMRVAQFLGWAAGLRRLHGARRRQRIAAVLHDCDLEHVAGRLVGTLSKGYRQRVGLAQALLHEPRVLILDEPTVGLDPRQLIDIRTLIRGLRGRTTVLLSTHILSEVGMTCERVVVLNRGRVVAEDSAAALARHADGDRVLVRVGGPPDAVRAALTSVAGVIGVALAEGEPAGAAAFTVDVDGGDAARAAIARTMVEAGWPLLELRSLPLSLEDLFVRLTAAA